MMMGMMRHRIRFQQSVRTPDAGGGFTESWQDIDFTPEVSAMAQMLSSGEQFRQRQLNALATHRFVVRYRADITARMRVVKDGAAYNITSVLDRDGKKEWLEILVREV